jgi:sec-independent protein translocase protein TatB
MFDIGWSELLVIGVVAIVVVGPKELPRLMRTFGHYTGKLRSMASDFQRQFEEAVRDSEIDEVRKAMQDVHAQASDVRAAVNKPLMVPKPVEPAPAIAAETAPAPKTKPKPRANTPKASTAKTASTKTASKTVSPKPRAKTREDRAVTTTTSRPPRP